MKNSLLHNTLKSKGFILTFDAFLGLTLLAVLIIVSFGYVAQVNPIVWNNIDLINAGRDVSITFEKSNVFSNAIKQNSSELLVDKLDATPNSFCFEINIFESANLYVPKINVIKAGCNKNFDEFVVVNSSLVVNNGSLDFYMVGVGVWYK
jgi:hypothetical protein